MANLKVLKQKEKRYTFKVFENDKQEIPAICVFKRFPASEETFYSGTRQDIANNINIDAEELLKDKNNAVKKVLDSVVKTFLDNYAAGKIDYKEFARECIDRFEDFTVEETGKSINTVNEFLSLSEEYGEAVTEILRDCYKYAQERDKFTMGELTA